MKGNKFIALLQPREMSPIPTAGCHNEKHNSRRMPTLCEAISLKRPESCTVCDFSRCFPQSERSRLAAVSQVPAGCARSPQGLTIAKSIQKKCPNDTAESQYVSNSQKVAHQEGRGRSLSSTLSRWKHFRLQTFSRYGGEEKKKERRDTLLRRDPAWSRGGS